MILMIIQELHPLIIYLKYSIVVNGNLVCSVRYILELFRSWISLPWSHIIVPYDYLIMKDGLNLRSGKIVEFETARTSDGN